MSSVRPTKASQQRLVPEITPEQPPAAEILLGPNSLTVTVALPNVARADLDVFLTRNSVRVRSRTSPGALNYVIPLPVAIEPERYVMRHKNGVFDFIVERASH